MYAIAVSFEATALGRIVDLGVKIIDANEVRGVKAQPLNVWGHEAFRKSVVIGDNNLTTGTVAGLGFTADTRKYPIAPKSVAAMDKIVLPVFNEGGQIIGYKQVANVPKPNGDNIQSGLKHVAAPVSDTPAGKVSSNKVVKFTCATAGADMYYTTNGDEPTKASTKYTSAGITISATTTVKIFAVKAGYAPSEVGTYTYTV